MPTITTKLTTSGNSSAVRLPKELLRMSGLGSTVQLEARKGKIIISKTNNPRAGWVAQIKRLIAERGDPTLEFGELQAAHADGLDDLTWNGPSFENWQKTHGKVS